MHQVKKESLTLTKNIPVAGPWITEKEIAYVNDAINNGWYDHANDYINRFEKAFTLYLGRRYAISLPSCTSGLHLSLLAAGVKPDDEVIVPDMTWIASAAPITYVGATPIFADCDPNTWCVSAKTIDMAITPRTKAVIVVNLYGNMPEWDDILDLCQERGIVVIEDAAESIGSSYKQKLSGTFGLTSCFSFHGSKTLTTGEGGMLVTDDEEVYQRCMIMRDHGRIPGDTLFQNKEVGYKYKMSALQAALGLAQLERINELVEKKRLIFQWYKEAFADVPYISLNPDHPDVFNSYWMSTVIWDHSIKKSKFDIITSLQKYGIQTRPCFDPLTSLEAYKERMLNSHKVTPNAYDIAARSINLPSAMSLTQEDVNFTAETLKDILL